MTAGSPQELLRRWAAAEAAADAGALAGFLAADFRGVGPLGYVLDRDRWLARYADGLAVASFALSEVEVREHGPLAVALAVQTQSMTYRGRPSEGRFRVSALMHRGEEGWRLLGVQLSGPMPDGAP